MIALSSRAPGGEWASEAAACPRMTSGGLSQFKHSNFRGWAAERGSISSDNGVAQDADAVDVKLN